jgi:Family of unknown function (DUF6152)
MRGLLTACALIAGLGMAGSAYAHHSMSGFDRTKTVNLTGTIREFKWANPHSWIEMEVPDGKGGSQVWNVEMTAPGILARGGWKSTMLKPGDKVTVSIRPLINGEPGGQFVSVTLPDGLVMTERGRQQAPGGKQ